MEKLRYMISDAASLIQVEAHVLRYWEEELDLDIPRNEMGHRCYTQENIHQFEQIKRLKEEGFQLKAIRMLLHNTSSEEDTLQPELQAALERVSQDSSESAAPSGTVCVPEGTADTLRAVESGEQSGTACVAEGTADTLRAAESGEQSGTADTPRGTIPPAGNEMESTSGEPQSASEQLQPLSKLEQFQLMMNEIVKAAIAENNRALGVEISENVGEMVLKEMNYLMRDREEQEEERFRKLDEAIRSRQRRPKKEKRTFFRTSIHKAQEMS